MKRYGNHGDGRGLKWYRFVTLVKQSTWRISVPLPTFAHDCAHTSVDNNIHVPWSSSWKKILHGRLLNFTTTPQHSNVKSNVKSRKRITSSVFILWRNSKQWKMADSVNYQHFNNLVEAYERANSEKNKNTSQTAVGEVWKKIKAHFLAADEPEEIVRRQANKWKTLSFTKRSKITDFWYKAVQKIK